MKYKILSTDHNYVLSVDRSANNDNIYYLISTILFKGEYLDKIILGYATEDEINLSNGRFINYTRKKQENTVQMAIGAELIESLNATEKYLNFICNTVVHKWSLAAWITNFGDNGNTIYDFGFESQEEAVMFKLICS